MAKAKAVTASDAPETEGVAPTNTFRVFDARMATVAQVYDEEEAREIAREFNGSYINLA